MAQVLWYKRDLRLTDHAPLQQAMAQAPDHGAILPLYVHEPPLVGGPDFSAQHSTFLRECLKDFKLELTKYGGSLLECVGDAVIVFEVLWQQTGFQQLWSYQETWNAWTFERDKAVKDWCRMRGVTWTELPQNAVRRGSAYREQGFNFQEHLTHACEEPLFYPSTPIPFAPLPWETASGRDIPIGQGRDKPNRLKGGRKAALARLDEFLQLDKLLAYPTTISSPHTAIDGCSRLSPYLAFGVLSDREVFQALTRAVERECENPRLSRAKRDALGNSARFFAERLYWRSAYLQSLESHYTTELEGDLPAFNGVRENEFAPTWLSAWCEGRTGYPLIDAAMRMLAHTGWLNMRLRGTVTSFALNELWLPWKPVGLHLAREFLDYEPGIHWNQLQIHAGSSRLSGPLTYNVLKQAQDHDEHGRFVRQWVPELANVKTEYIFEPWRMPTTTQVASRCRIGADYPAPLVGLTAAHDAARQRVAALREGKPEPNLAYWKLRTQMLAQDKQGSLF